MAKGKVVKSKLNIFNFIILFLGSMAGIFLGIKFTLIGFDKLSVLFVGVSFLLLGLLAMYYFINFNVIYITNDKLIFKSLFGYTKKSIFLSEITSYNEIKKENSKFKYEAEHMKWNDLTLYGDSFKYKISSTSYNNYSELKSVLIKGLKRDYNSEINWERNNSLYYGIGFLIFGLIISFWLGINSNDITDIVLTIIFSLFFIIYGIYLINKNNNLKNG